MATFKPDLKITISTATKSLSISALKLPSGHYLIKCGRANAKKMPLASVTKIFELSRKWAVKHG